MHCWFNLAKLLWRPWTLDNLEPGRRTNGWCRNPSLDVSLEAGTNSVKWWTHVVASRLQQILLPVSDHRHRQQHGSLNEHTSTRTMESGSGMLAISAHPSDDRINCTRDAVAERVTAAAEKHGCQCRCRQLPQLSDTVTRQLRRQ